MQVKLSTLLTTVDYLVNYLDRRDFFNYIYSLHGWSIEEASRDMAYHYSGVFSHANDITLLSPSGSGLFVLISDCKKYAAKYDILFMVTRTN